MISTRPQPRRAPRVPDVGLPGLVAAIAAEIRETGPISFERFMELALYHPTLGYYTRLVAKPDAEVGAAATLVEDRIGWSGDYYTSSDVSPVWAQAVLKQVEQMDRHLGRPDPFTFVEMGAGKGRFARDLLEACRETAPELFQRLRYVIIERSAAMQHAQRRQLAAVVDQVHRVTWLTSVGELGTDSVVGSFFSNELVDAFPVHRIRVVGADVREVFVDEVDGRFVERLQRASPAVQAHLAHLARLGIRFGEGTCAELNLRAVEWMKELARSLQRGFVITVDYGHPAADLYGSARRTGTLLCYYHQMISEDPYTRVGLQDMTAHVDFTTLARVGEAEGLRTTGFTNQLSFLMGLGVERIVERLEPGSAEFQSVLQLLRPDGMGTTFKVLIQHKGVQTCDVDGLRYKPFRKGVLHADHVD